MFLRDALPRFYAEAVAAIKSKPDDEFCSVSRDALLAQFERLVIVERRGAGDSCGCFIVTAAGPSADRGYVFSFDFDIPSGNVILDLDRDFQIIGFEPISVAAQHDVQDQLDAFASR